MFIQAGFAVDSPTACHLVWGGRYMKADLTHQFVWWCLHKLAVISIGSHLSHLSENIMYISKTAIDTYLLLSQISMNQNRQWSSHAAWGTLGHVP